LRDPLIHEYKGITSAYAKGGWKHASLDGGRFCEIVYSILDGALSGEFPAIPKKPDKFVEACRNLTNRPKSDRAGDYSLRVLLPRVLPGMYEIRNNRNVGHVGGDVVANKMDAGFVRETATWVLCELVRVFHGIETAEAQSAVDSLTEKRHPLVWEFDGFRRVLDPYLSAADRTLVLLYAAPGWTSAKALQEAVMYGKNYRTQVLETLEEKALIIFDRSFDRAVITPLGSNRAEAVLAKAQD
jgi:hypothetical protein